MLVDLASANPIFFGHHSHFGRPGGLHLSRDRDGAEAEHFGLNDFSCHRCAGMGTRRDQSAAGDLGCVTHPTQLAGVDGLHGIPVR